MELTVDGPVCGLAHDYFNLMIVSFDCIVIRSNSMMFVTITVLMFVLMCNARFEMSMPMIMLNYMNMKVILVRIILILITIRFQNQKETIKILTTQRNKIPELSEKTNLR